MTCTHNNNPKICGLCPCGHGNPRDTCVTCEDTRWADDFPGLMERSSKAADLERQGWQVWLSTLAPDSCSAPFSSEQVEFWDLYWDVLQRQRKGEPVANAEKNVVLPLGRGNAKSTSAELAVVAEGCILDAGFALYLSDSQLLAEEHLYSVKSILENGHFAKYYPKMAKPKVSQTGAQAKFTQDTIITENGWGMTARGITGNVRGGRLGTLRFTLIIADDVDSLTDSLAVIEKKKRILSRSVYPAMDKNFGKTIFAQNLITENSVASQIVYRKTDILSERTVIGEKAGFKKGVPAFKQLELDTFTRDDGSIIWKIGKAESTWAYFNVQDAENFLALSGKESFLAEYQHEFASRSGKVIPNYNEDAQIITWSEFEKVFGERSVPKHWREVCGVDVGFSDGMHPHYSAWSFITVAAMNSPLPGAHFVYRSRTFKGTAIEDQAEAIWQDLVINDEFSVDKGKFPLLSHLEMGEGRQLSHWQMSHEATSEMLTLRMRYGMPFTKLTHYKKTDGVAQWNHLSMCDHSKPNPFKQDEHEDGEWFIGRPSLYYIVDDDQATIPKDDRGMKLLREQVSTWEYVPVKVTEAGLTEERPSKVNDDTCDSIRALLYWLAAAQATPLTASEKLEQRMPEVIKDRPENAAQRALWLQREAKRTVQKQREAPASHENVMNWLDRRI